MIDFLCGEKKVASKALTIMALKNVPREQLQITDAQKIVNNAKVIKCLN